MLFMKSTIIKLATLLLIISAFSANTAYSQQKISLFTWVPAEEQKINKQLIEEFQRRNPDITVAYMNDPTKRSMDKLQTMFVAGTAPDVMSIHGAYFVPFASRGLLLPLNGLIKKDTEFNLSAFYSTLIDGCKYNNKLYSLPRFTSVYVLFYNKKLFDEAGIKYPDETWTWQEFLNASIKLTKDSNKDGITDQYGCVLDFWGARLYPWIWQNDSTAFDAEKNICTLNYPKTAEALQFLCDLRFKHKVVPVTISMESKSNVEMFRTGKAGMFMSGAWEIQNLRYDNKINWGIAPLPKNAKRATMLGMENYAIYSKSKKPDAAWKLMKFLLNEKNQLLLATNLEKQPSLISVAKEYAKNNEDFSRKVLTDAMNYGVVPPNFKQWNRIETVMQEKLDSIWIGKLDLKKGLDEATERINKILNEK